MTRIEFPVLETPRLRLEPFTVDHSDCVYSLWSNPAVCRYSGDAEDWQGDQIELPAPNFRESDKILDYFIRRAEAETGVRWAVFSRENMRGIGAVGLNALSPNAEIAYHLHPDDWGFGYATEACRAVIDWTWQALPANSIEAYANADNVPSIALAMRLGFVARSDSREGAQRFELLRQGD